MLSRRMTDAKVTGFCALLSVAIFAVDVIAPLGVAGGVPYVAPILIASWASRRRSILIFAAAGAALTVLGYFLSEPGGPHWMVLTNRAIALFAIWITAVLAYTRKRTEEALGGSETRSRAIFDQAAVGMGLMTPGGRFLAVNQRLCELMGRQAPELLKMRFNEFTHPDDYEDCVKQIVRLVAGEISTFTTEMRYVPMTGVTLWGNLTVSLVREPSSDRISLLGVVEDITERKRAEAELRHAQKLEAVGLLTAGVAHEFNNLLHANLGFLELLERELEDNTDLRQLVEGASGAAWRAAEITGKLLAFGRNQMLRPRTIDFNTIVPGMTSILRSTMGAVVEIETVLPGNLWQAKADPAQVESALVNLALNARDAMPQGGKLTIETANAHIDRDLAANFSEARTGDYVKLAVSDNGSGMPPEVMEHAFEPFFTTKDVGKGTGLGLSMVYGFAQQSKGFVVIDSEVGRGTRVELYVPKAPDTSEERGAAP